jgi:hypothetical protein
MAVVPCVALASIAPSAGCWSARTRRHRRRAAHDVLRRVFRRREYREINGRLELIAVDELRRLELGARRYVAGDVGYVVVTSDSRPWHRPRPVRRTPARAGGVNRSMLGLLERGATEERLQSALVRRDGFSYRLTLRGETGAEVEVFARRVTLAPWECRPSAERCTPRAAPARACRAESAASRRREPAADHREWCCRSVAVLNGDAKVRSAAADAMNVVAGALRNEALQARTQSGPHWQPTIPVQVQATEDLGEIIQRLDLHCRTRSTIRKTVGCSRSSISPGTWPTHIPHSPAARSCARRRSRPAHPGASTRRAPPYPLVVPPLIRRGPWLQAVGSSR